MKLKAFVVCAALALCASHSFAVAHTEVTKAPRLPFRRGMGFSGYNAWDRDSDTQDPGVYSNLVSKGFDHIRFPADMRNFTLWNSSDGTFEFCTKTIGSSWSTNSSAQWAKSSLQRSIAIIDNAVDLAERNGLYIYLDLFHGWKYINAQDPVSTNQFVSIWKAVAERYKDRSNKVIFELMSEQGSDFSGFNTLHRNTIKEIRKTNPTRLILFSSPAGSQPWVLTQAANPPKFSWIGLPQNDNNIAVAVHCYNPIEFTHQGVTWAPGNSTTNIPFSDKHRLELNQDLRWCVQYMEGTGVPLVMNEFNVENKVAAKPDITEYLSIVTRWCEAHKVPWAPWEYYSGGGMDCFDTRGSLLSYIEPGLFPDIKTTDKFSAVDYAKAIDVTFPGYSGSNALVNFPVLVKFSEDGICGFRYSDFQRPDDGFDLCFTDANGKLLAHEIDTWNTNGVSTVWVKVPSLTSSTKIVARYGCAKPIVPKVESVWDSDYVGVWHMGEQKLPLADSSNVSRDVTSADGTGIGYGAAGIAGGAVDFGAADSARSVNMDDHMMLDGFTNVTVEAWTKQSAHAKYAGIVSKRDGGELSYCMYDSGSGTEMRYSADGASGVSAGVSLSPEAGRWNHQAFSLDATLSSSNSKGYLNGALAGTAGVSLPGGVFAGGAELHVGNLRSGNVANFPGQIDEVRISKCVRSADWIKASYDTVAKRGFAEYAVQGVAVQNPTLYVDIATGEEELGDSEVKEWTTKIVKDGDGTVVASPVSSTSVANLEVRRGTVKLAPSASASVVSKIGEHVFASGTKLDLSGKSYSVADLKGSPTVANAATFAVSGSWTMVDLAPMTVTGALAFGSGADVVLDESLLASVGREGVAIATATGGISGMPGFASLDYALKLSADGKSLIVFDNIPDVADWTAFSKKMSVAFAGAQSGVTLTNFPVLVKLSTAIDGFSYADFKRPDGEDLRFADQDGNLIPHEIDTWNPNGVSTVWVKVHELTASTEITAYYGCLHPVRAMPAKDVWDDDYVGVWHLGERALPLKESSGTSSDFESSEGAGIGFAAQGAVGGSLDFSAADKSSGVIAPDHDSLDGFPRATIEAWTKEPAWKHGAVMLSKRVKGNAECAYYLYESTNATARNVALYAGTNRASSAKWSCNLSPSLGEWNHLAYTADMTQSSKNVYGYLNGTAKSSSVTFLSDSLPAAASTLCLGNGQNGGSAMNQLFPGCVDEVRISKTVRSAAWLKATHDTVANADFATYEVHDNSTQPPEPPDPPEPQDGFAHAVEVTFSGYSGGAALTDFPVLVRLSTAIPGFSYSDFQIADGGDLRFFDAAGNMLAHEIDTWDTSGVSTVWVKVPTLDASTKITAKYGCSEPPEAADPKSVWSNGYSGVWHMGGATRKQADSTSSGKNMEGHSTYSANMTFGADGAVGGAVEQATPPEAGGRYRGGFQASDSSGLYNDSKTLTVEMWASAREIVNDKYILRNKTGNTLYSGRWSWSTAGGCKLTYTVAMTNLAAGTGHEYKGLAYSVATNDLPGAWRHYALVVDNEALHRIEAYQDGASKKTQAISDAGESLAAGSGTMAFGNSSNSNTNQAFAGTIDELRISRVARSADWIKATHDTVMNADFATYAMSGGGTAAGYAAWIAGKGITGAAAASDKVTNGIANGVRYAFDIAPATSEIGTPIIQVVRDANGNPSVLSRDLATGRDDVTFGILATPDLTDWSNATLVPMTKFATDGLWRPTASESSGYVFPSQMFFKYTLEIQE